MNTTDIKYINRCFELAVLAKGNVSPNPMVGCVIVKNDEAISEGYHEASGEKHAEADALSKINYNASGATLYCNLEPCCHTNKKTPPCVPLIIKSGISKVVISNIDPNPEVAGKGIELLRNEGIEVISGLLENEGKELNKAFFKYIENHRPYVIVKIAATLDNKISAKENTQTWITCEESQKFVHSLRAESDAVLVGAGTVNIDNPKLNVRLTEGRNPYKIILADDLNINLEANVIQNEPEKTIIVTSLNTPESKISSFQKLGVKIIKIKSDTTGLLNLDELLGILADEKITSILVEGGASVFSQFIDQELFDELIVIKAPKIFGEGIDAFRIKNQQKLKIKETGTLDSDIKMIFTKGN